MYTVLVVNTDPVERNEVMKYLTLFGYDLLEAASAAEALRIANDFEGEIHLVVVGPQELSNFASRIAGARPNLAILFISSEPEQSAPSGSLPPTVSFASVQRPVLPTVLANKVHDLLRTN
jgi:DNA-binding response OmpR family regulator